MPSVGGWKIKSQRADMKAGSGCRPSLLWRMFVMPGLCCWCHCLDHAVQRYLVVMSAAGAACGVAARDRAGSPRAPEKLPPCCRILSPRVTTHFESVSSLLKEARPGSRWAGCGGLGPWGRCPWVSRGVSRLCTSAGPGGEASAGGLLAVVCSRSGGSRRAQGCGKSP